MTQPQWEKEKRQIKKLAKDLTGRFCKESMQMANKPMKGCRTWVISSEVQIKTTRRGHFNLVGMPVTKQTNKMQKNKQTKNNPLAPPPNKKPNRITSVGVEVEKQELLCSAGGIVNRSSPALSSWTPLSAAKHPCTYARHQSVPSITAFPGSKVESIHMSMDKAIDERTGEPSHSGVRCSREDESSRAPRESIDTARTQCRVKKGVAGHEAERDTVYCTTQAAHQEAGTVKDTYTGL